MIPPPSPKALTRETMNLSEYMPPSSRNTVHLQPAVSGREKPHLNPACAVTHCSRQEEKFIYLPFINLAAFHLLRLDPQLEDPWKDPLRLTSLLAIGKGEGFATAWAGIRWPTPACRSKSSKVPVLLKAAHQSAGSSCHQDTKRDSVPIFLLDAISRSLALVTISALCPSSSKSIARSAIPNSSPVRDATCFSLGTNLSTFGGPGKKKKKATKRENNKGKEGVERKWLPGVRKIGVDGWEIGEHPFVENTVSSKKGTRQLHES